MAIQIIKDIAADVIKRGSTRAIYAKQNDLNSRFLSVRIQEEGKDLVVNPNVTVLFNVERPDEQKNIFNGTVNEDGTVKVPLAPWMLELEGTVLCDISLVSPDPNVAKLTTMRFVIEVEPAVVSDGDVPEVENPSTLADLLVRVEALEEAVKEGGASITVDDALSPDSTNPVQNKVIFAHLEEATNVLEQIQGSIPSDDHINVLIDEYLSEALGGDY